MKRSVPRTVGWVLIPLGLGTALVGVVMAWDARLHNSIVTLVVENPRP